MPILMSYRIAKLYTYIIMRNLLAESMEISTSSYYLSEDGTKSDKPSYNTVTVKIELSDGVNRIYQIQRSGFVGKTNLKYAPSHTISGTTYDRNVEYWSRESGKRFMCYQDDASFAKAIQAIQKRIKG